MSSWSLHVLDVDAAEHRGLAQVRRHDLGVGNRCRGRRRRRPTSMRGWPVEETRTGIDHEVGEQTLVGEPATSLDGRRLGEHAGLDGAHLEVLDDAEHLGDDERRIDVLHRVTPTVFCAVTAVRAVVAWTSKAQKVRRSA
jgi:hypothetical protein